MSVLEVDLRRPDGLRGLGREPVETAVSLQVEVFEALVEPLETHLHLGGESAVVRRDGRDGDDVDEELNLQRLVGGGRGGGDGPVVVLGELHEGAVLLVALIAAVNQHVAALRERDATPVRTGELPLPAHRQRQVNHVAGAKAASLGAQRPRLRAEGILALLGRHPTSYCSFYLGKIMMIRIYYMW